MWATICPTISARIRSSSYIPHKTNWCRFSVTLKNLACLEYLRTKDFILLYEDFICTGSSFHRPRILTAFWKEELTWTNMSYPSSSSESFCTVSRRSITHGLFLNTRLTVSQDSLPLASESTSLGVLTHHTSIFQSSFSNSTPFTPKYSHKKTRPLTFVIDLEKPTSFFGLSTKARPRSSWHHRFPPPVSFPGLHQPT